MDHHQASYWLLKEYQDSVVKDGETSQENCPSMPVTAVYEAYKAFCEGQAMKPMPPNQLGRYVFSLFGLTKTKRMDKERKYVYLYRGLKMRPPASMSPIFGVSEFALYLALNYNFVVKHTEESQASVLYIREEKANGHAIIVDVHIGYDAVSVRIGEKPISLERHGFKRTFVYNQANCSTFALFVQKLRLCVGKPVPRDFKFSKSMMVTDRDGRQMVNGRRCLRTVPFIANGNCCLVCVRAICRATKQKCSGTGGYLIGYRMTS